MKVEEKYNQKLLVEGNEEQHIIKHLRTHHGAKETFDVIDCGSITNVYPCLESYLKQSDTISIGVILDADTNFDNRWQSVRDKLTAYGFEVPESLPIDGLVTGPNNGKRIGVWIMPDNEAVGMLEDFVAFLIPETDALKVKAEQVLEEIEAANINGYQDIHRAKALIYTWLAWQETPGTPMGRAITKKYLNANSEHAQRFVNWLNRLFNP